MRHTFKFSDKQLKWLQHINTDVNFMELYIDGNEYNLINDINYHGLLTYDDEDRIILNSVREKWMERENRN